MKYFYIYKDANDSWCKATNLEFVAKHQKCRAIEKNLLLNRFNSVRNFINKANDLYNHSDAQTFIYETDLKEIL